MRKMLKLFIQIFKFGIVGGICFVIDYVILFVLSQVMNYLLAAVISYLSSTVVNYLLSMRFVFATNDTAYNLKDFIVFVVLSTIGLGITVASMYVFTDVLGLYYMYSKVINTAIVMIFNFVTRKILLEQKKITPASFRS